MTPTDLFARWRAYGPRDALVKDEQITSYADLDAQRQEWMARLRQYSRDDTLPVVGIQADYSVASLACLFAVWSLGGIAALIPPFPTDESQMLADAQVGLLFRQSQTDSWQIDTIGHRPSHPLLQRLRNEGVPGLLLFTTGSSGRPKAVLHDAKRFLGKFRTEKTPHRTLAFMLFDHVAGIDILFSTFSSGGTLIIPMKRDPATICGLIQNHRVEVLPASPTFLRLLCISGEVPQFDCSSLKIITYGSEPMTSTTLTAIREQFPEVRLIQKYGSTEFGSPPSSTKRDNGLWLKLDSASTRIRVIDRMLWIKTESTMLGYLNVPTSPIQDGWFPTGDEVVVEGDWIRILGRKSEVIRVGGEKVHPQEVEAVIAELPNVAEVIVTGEPHPFLGEIVVATVSIQDMKQRSLTIKDIRAHCRKRLAAHKIPLKISIIDRLPTSYRHKKIRRLENESLLPSA